MSKTRPDTSSPADNARRRRGAASLAAPISLSISPAPELRKPGIARKDRCGAAWGLPLSVRCESIEGAEVRADTLKNQELITPDLAPARKLPPRSEARHIRA